jgi:hypothetical protein
MGSVKATIDIAGLDAYIHQRSREAVEEALGDSAQRRPVARRRRRTSA